ncbi:hypothetical protein QTV49_000309 [Vibrio vulnificus]|nr:hypothetical protein [Vibrio vulnificus]
MNKFKRLPFRLALPALAAVVSFSSFADGEELEAMLSSATELTSEEIENYAAKYGIDFSSPKIETKGSTQIPIQKEYGNQFDGDSSSQVIRVTNPVTKISEQVLVEKGILDQRNMEKALVEESLPLSSLYLRNIPEDSLLTFNQKFTLLPYETTAFFQDGKRIYGKPALEGDLPVSFCMLNFSESGKGRRATEKTSVVVSKVEEHNSLFQKNELDNGTLVRVTKLTIDNPEFKQIVCMGAGVSQPLSIGDMSKITGNLINVTIQNYVDI